MWLSASHPSSFRFALLTSTKYQLPWFCSTSSLSPSLLSTSPLPEHGKSLSVSVHPLRSSIPACFCSSLCCQSSLIRRLLARLDHPYSLLGERKYSHAIPPVSIVVVEVCWTSVMTVLTFVSSILSTRLGPVKMCSSSLGERIAADAVRRSINRGINRQPMRPRVLLPSWSSLCRG